MSSYDPAKVTWTVLVTNGPKILINKEFKTVVQKQTAA